MNTTENDIKNTVAGAYAAASYARYYAAEAMFEADRNPDGKHAAAAIVAAGQARESAYLAGEAACDLTTAPLVRYASAKISIDRVRAAADAARKAGDDARRAGNRVADTAWNNFRTGLASS